MTNYGLPSQGWAQRAVELRRALNSRLHDDDFERIDQAIMMEARERLVVMGDLLAENRVGIGSIGTMLSTYRRSSTMDGAQQSMSGRARSPLQSIDRDEVSVPIPLTYVDFDIDFREQAASEQGMEPLDTASAREASRSVAELLEDTAIVGGITHAGNQIFGYTNHPDRNTVSIGTAWDDETDPGEAALADVLSGLQAASDDNYNGMFHLYVPGNYGDVVLEDDFKAETAATTRERLEAIRKIVDVKVVDRLADDNVLLVQNSSEVADVVVFSEPELIAEMENIAFVTMLKVWSAMAPRIKSDFGNQSGIVHIS